VLNQVRLLPTLRQSLLACHTETFRDLSRELRTSAPGLQFMFGSQSRLREREEKEVHSCAQLLDPVMMPVCTY